MKLDSLENRTFPSLQKKNPYSNVVKEKLITRNQQNSLRLLQKTKKNSYLLRRLEYLCRREQCDVDYLDFSTISNSFL